MSSTLSQEEIDSIRADLEAELLPDTATIYETRGTPDGQGGFTNALKARSEGVEARLDPLKQRAADPEQVVADRPSATAGWLITFPAATVVKPTDVIELNGTRFEVKRIRSRAAWELTVRVECVQVDAGGEVERDE